MKYKELKELNIIDNNISYIKTLKKVIFEKECNLNLD